MTSELPSFKVTVSPTLFRPSAPLLAVCTVANPKMPVGVPPPKMTIAHRLSTTVPAGKVWRKLKPSESVHPDMSSAPPVLFIISTNSSSLKFRTPSPLASPVKPDAGSARISLMITREGTVHPGNRDASIRPFSPDLAQGLAAFKAASNWGNVAEYTICKKPTFLEKVGFYKW